MRLLCPNCSTAYDVPDAALAGRSRKLRCAQCGMVWRTDAPETAAPEPVLPAVERTDGMPAEVAAEPQADAGPAPLKQMVEPAPVPEEYVPVGPRQFGRPVDEAAQAEIAQAVEQEEAHPPVAEEDGLPTFLARGPDPGGAEPPDRFAELVHAARNKAVEYEPEPLPGPAVRTSSMPLAVGLLVAFVVALILLEHRTVAHLVPGLGRAFGALGLK